MCPVQGLVEGGQELRTMALERVERPAADQAFHGAPVDDLEVDLGAELVEVLEAVFG
ncbi:hypothetical protein D3C72_1973710 [compost metagenome]